MADSIGQVLHLTASQGRMPGSSYEVDVREAQTRRSLRFFMHQKVIRGAHENALRSRSET